MIHLQPLAQSRQVQLDQIPTPSKNQTKVHRLGGLSRAQSLKQPVRYLNQSVKYTSTSQQAVFTFSSSNPFYLMHQAMHQQPAKTSKTQPAQKCFQDVIREVHETKEICEKLLTPQKEQHQEEYHKTLIMDLQKLQTNRVDLEKAQNELHESQVSINGQVMEDSKLCLHGHCQKINSALERALDRLNELEQGNQRLEKVLEEEKMSKKVAESENSSLRQEIARVDEQKCAEIKRLRQEIEKIKRQKQNDLGDVPIYEVERVPINNVSEKSMKKMQPQQRPILAAIQVEPNLKESVLVSASHQQEITQYSMKKLKHVVYL